MQVWFITGCSSGFGRNTASLALEQGDKVIATARRADKIADLKERGALTISMDVTAPIAELKTKVAEAIKMYGRIDILLNNAGYVQTGAIEELTEEEWQGQFDTNVFGPVRLTKLVLPYMRQQRSGIVANVSSLGAWKPYAGCGSYDTSKAALTAITENLALEVQEFGITAITIEPGFFRTDLLTSNNQRGPRQPLEDYDGTAARVTANAVESANGKQAGDPVKASKVIVDVLSGKTGKHIPGRLVLGSDCYQMVKEKCEETLKHLEDWKDLSCSTDYVG